MWIFLPHSNCAFLFFWHGKIILSHSTDKTESKHSAFGEQSAISYEKIWLERLKVEMHI
jgi:hypothetical protein